ncbi:acyl carrier protein [Aeromicrobium sp. 9AM]|uniref:acyl carrier protein n=1 Tax=Aeromicrobium sp. 9AM TaxID=2653126 RepID=UPI00135975F3|nr:acyl carrier protein [Aeromicrobium sp. 9AM]
MPSSSSVHEQLTDILVRVVGCPADAVVPEANLKELGTDSLTIVETAEELGRRFDVYLSDDTVDTLVTVQDAIDAVVRHDGSTPPARSGRVPTTLESPAPPVRDEEHVRRRRLGERLIILFVLLGAGLGAILGFGGSALIEATGLGSVNLPPISNPTTAPTSSPTDTPTPEPTETTTPDASKPKPTIKVSKEQVSPGERFTIQGTFAGAGEGAELQIQVKDEGSDWDDFPIETTTRSGGKFKTQIYTSRTGDRQFRLLNKKTDEATPAVTVQIG